MTTQRNQLEVSSAIDGQTEIRPADAWLGISDFNVRQITVVGSDIDLYSHVRTIGGGIVPIYAGSDPRMYLQGDLSDVLRSGIEGINTFNYDYAIEGFGEIDRRVSKLELSDTDKRGFTEAMEVGRQYTENLRTEFVARRIADLGALIRTEEPGYWVRDGSPFAQAKAQKLIAEKIKAGVWEMKVPKDGHVFSKIFQLNGIEIHHDKKGRPRTVPIVTDRFGNQGPYPYTRETSLYIQEAAPLQVTA